MLRTAIFLLLSGIAANAQPRIQFAVNAASFARPTADNGKISRGSLVALTGRGLGPEELQRAAGFPLPAEMAGVTAEVTSGTSTFPALIESVFSTHTNILLPSSVPAGPASIKLTVAGAASAAFPVTVAERSIGIFTLSGTGRGTAILTRPENSKPSEAANSILTAARPGETWEVWVTGLGPAGANDAEAPSEENLGLPVEVLVGGTAAQVEHVGRASCCPGYAKIRFRVPDGVAGCCVPLVVKLDGIISNEASISVSGEGGTCVDPGLTPEVLDLYRREGGFRSASLAIVRAVQLGAAGAPSTGTVAATASFTEMKVRGLHRYACLGQGVTPPTGGPVEVNSSTRTIGACTVSRQRIDLQQPGPGPAPTPSEPVPSQPLTEATYDFRTLDAGPAISISGSAGSVDLPRRSVPGVAFISYQRSELFAPPEPVAGTPAALLLAPGRKTFRGPSGPDVPAFSVDLEVNGSLVWTNAAQIEAVNRAQPLNVTWTGGASGSPVYITGASTVISPTFTSIESANFVCQADAAAAAFTVPQEVVNELLPSPAASPIPSGSLGVGTTWLSQTPLAGFDQSSIFYSDTTSKPVRVF